ncbi:MAG TPA: pyridoxamine 5'-phosphate oxidase family protein [Candidatus Saccharimonadales bacterium]
MTPRDVLAFVRMHDLMMLATVDPSGKPQAAVVEFGELDDFTLIFDTLTTSRKYTNLQHDGRVAIVIGWDKSITVQLDGVAHELRGTGLEAAKQAYFTKNSLAQKWKNRPDIAYFAVRPTWLRYSDLNRDPWYVQEYDREEIVG